MIKAWKNCPLPTIPQEERTKHKSVGICRGSCNSLKRIDNVTYQLCSHCSNKYRWFGASCDVPNCEAIGDGSLGFNTRENKIVCLHCYDLWRRMDFCIWERLVEQRHLVLLRPDTYVKALEEGLVSIVDNPVNEGDIAECKYCKKQKTITGSLQYQLCGSCAAKLRYYGEKCSVGGTEPCPNSAMYFDTQETRYVCNGCAQTKGKYNLSSYAMYETQIRTKNNCMICEKSVSHNKAEGERKCSAYIDHDHKTGKTRGILCHQCNVIEGLTENLPIDALTYAKNLVAYLEHPPLSESWIQKS